MVNVGHHGTEVIGQVLRGRVVFHQADLPRCCRDGAVSGFHDRTVLSVPSWDNRCIVHWSDGEVNFVWSCFTVSSSVVRQGEGHRTATTEFVVCVLGDHQGVQFVHFNTECDTVGRHTCVPIVDLAVGRLLVSHVTDVGR